MANVLYNGFKNLSAKGLSMEKPVLTLQTTDTVEKAVKLFTEHRIHSAPVKAPSGEVVGFVDTLDILRHVVSAAPDKHEIKQDELKTLTIAGRAFSLVPLERAVNISGRDALVQIFEDDPATHVIDVLAKGVHRVALYNKAQEVTHIVSQKDVVTWLKPIIRRGEHKIIGQKTLRELGFVNVAAETIPASAKVVDALQKMNGKGVGCLAVVHPKTGVLCGNFSASDLHGLYESDFPRLLETVEDFLDKFSPKSLSAIVSHPDAAFQTIIDEMHRSGVSHVWVVDGDFKPVGVITQTDVMRIIKTASL